MWITYVVTAVYIDISMLRALNNILWNSELTEKYTRHDMAIFQCIFY